MRNKESLIRLHRFQVDERRAQVSDLELMLEEFHRREDDLHRQVKYEPEQSWHYGHRAFLPIRCLLNPCWARAENIPSIYRGKFSAQLDGLHKKNLPQHFSGTLKSNNWV